MQPVKRKKRTIFFVVMGVIGMLAIHIGFATTYIIPVAEGNFKAPLSIYIHGAFTFLWVLFFLLQSILIQIRKVRFHRKLGIATMLIAMGAAITTPVVGIFSVEKELAAGLGGTSYSLLFGTFSTPIMFLSFVIAGYIYRHRIQSHKRLMLLATIIILWPAWFRFRHYFPSVPRPDIWFGIVLADSLIIIAWIWDRFANGRIHRALLYGGILIIAENAFEAWQFDNTWWRDFSFWLYQMLTN